MRKKRWLLLIICAPFIFEILIFTNAKSTFLKQTYSTSNSHIEKILNQPFTYSNQGGNCNVYFSEDGKYVLKAFRSEKKFSKRSPLLKYIPYLKNFANYAWKLDAKNRVHKGCIRGFQTFPKETGILYYQFAPNPSFDGKNIFLNEKKTSINSVNFYLQKAAISTYNYLIDAPPSIAMEQMFELIMDFYQKGIILIDLHLSSNCGFVNDSAIRLDVDSMLFLKWLIPWKLYKFFIIRDLKTLEKKLLKRGIKDFDRSLIEKELTNLAKKKNLE